MKTISYVMGARGDFLSQFFWGTDLSTTTYKSFGYSYKKYHTVDDFPQNPVVGTHLFIDYNINDNDMITLFMWEKTISSLDWKITVDQLHNNDLLNHFTKIYFTMLDSWQENIKLKKQSYTHIINFQDFFDIDLMSQHYFAVTGDVIDQPRMDFLCKNNHIQQENFNNIIEKHPVKLAHMIFKFETLNNLTQEQRQWSIVDLLTSSSTFDNKVHTLNNLLNFTNYKLK